LLTNFFFFFTGQAQPPNRGGRGGPPDQRRQSSRGGHDDYYDDDLADFTPLVSSANRWIPSKDNSVMAKIEKQMKSLLNKMTKEKFDKLSTQMCDIPIQSYEMLALVIKLVYEKAITEPSFSDMYANLCYRLSQMVKKGTFIKIIEESDEDPLAEGGEVDYSEGGSGSVSYRWSNDVSTSDAEIVGPFENEQQSIDAALADEDTTPVKRGELELTLHRLLIRRGKFIKIMHSQADDKYYIVFFPIAQAHECGQQLSQEIFTSEIEAQNHAIKMNTFKRSLLNKCEDEFNQQDIYTDWKVEKKEYEKKKASLTEKERAEKAEELEFRRMKIKKQMLGNIKFSKCLVHILNCSSPSHILTFFCFQLVNCTSSACSKKRL
jgi:translation initiation factor 4G